MCNAREEKNLRHIWLAGGCFWGVEAYLSRIEGVIMFANNEF